MNCEECKNLSKNEEFYEYRNFDGCSTVSRCSKLNKMRIRTYMPTPVFCPLNNNGFSENKLSYEILKYEMDGANMDYNTVVSFVDELEQQLKKQSEMVEELKDKLSDAEEMCYNYRDS